MQLANHHAVMRWQGTPLFWPPSSPNSSELFFLFLWTLTPWRATLSIRKRERRLSNMRALPRCCQTLWPWVKLPLSWRHVNKKDEAQYESWRTRSWRVRVMKNTVKHDKVQLVHDDWVPNIITVMQSHITERKKQKNNNPDCSLTLQASIVTLKSGQGHQNWYKT